MIVADLVSEEKEVRLEIEFNKKSVEDVQSPKRTNFTSKTISDGKRSILAPSSIDHYTIGKIIG
jgi:hypothetical protein